MESEPDEDMSDKERYIEVSLPEGDDEPSELVDDSVWNKYFFYQKGMDIM